jgi:hypothetical protein
MPTILRRILSDNNCPQKSLAVEIQATKQELQADHRMQRRLGNAKNSSIPALYAGLVRADSLVAGCERVDCFDYVLADATLIRAGRR